MAKKPNPGRKGSRQQQARQRPTRRPQRRRRLVLGGVLLALVIAVGVWMRIRQQSQVLPALQGTVEGHYTRGVPGAPVVIKEFSDYT
jgi:ferric-dicitrate binding protein FerR (iron transport regulator)